MPNNGFLPFATGVGANVPTDTAWAAYAALAQGFQAGVAPSAGVNKALRQSTVLSSALGQFIADYAQQDTSDSQSVATLEGNYRIALAAALDGARMGVDTSSIANTITFPLTPLPPTLSGLKIVYFKPANTNTAASTAQILKSDGTPAFSSSATPIKRRDGADVQAGDLVAGVWYGSIWDGATAKLIGLTKSEIAALGVGSGALLNIQILTASGTYTPTPGTKKALVFATGGGGAGGGAGSTNGNGDGGESGATAIALVPLTGVTSVVSVIGAGGAPSALGAAVGTRGGTGGNTSFGSYLSNIPGGAGGLNQAFGGSSAGNTVGGTIANGAVGLILPGNPGIKTPTGIGGPGASSFWGGGAIAIDGNSPDNSTHVPTAGAPAVGYGSGGGGADNVIGPGGTNVLGGVGMGGVIFILEFA